MQIDLFDQTQLAPSTPAGFTHHDAVIDAAEEEMLICAVERFPLTPFRFQGWEGKRLTFSFGWAYDFETAQVAAAPPMPDWLLRMRARAADFMGLADEELVQALLIRYDPGASIGWHRDRPIFEHVVGISLGAPATLRLRLRADGGFRRHGIPLPRRSIYGLTGDVRHRWEHSIAPMEQTRWSITFRSLSESGRRLLGH
ncbi:alpha-ketoglutarate-dependent dioxygenase AlkB [Sphingobium sp. YR768]|uniref:alpha-ketoglutarate-dependent dioxygenase AlkB n=1 Tax=Sphingobium sp. YR768 TaxID=1884365 RepID=UPI0008D6585A|nr:alpha-ketoglutarate-dependent dioxygenase AlkB [Sphingobium sp. YR768]SER13612.1 Alkylated DNA repair dioxygenase AlkB [Sphingobium sp. YR768]